MIGSDIVVAPSILNIVLNVFLIIFSMTILYSILIMIVGPKLFVLAKKNKTSARIPILNLFSTLEIVEMSPFIGILFFIPIANLIVLCIMSYKLGYIYGMDFSYRVGLVILPIIFYPLLMKKKIDYNANDEKYFSGLDNIKGESVNLMTQKEIMAQSENVVENKNDVDSIFKSDIKLKTNPVAYKAQKIDIFKTIPNDKVKVHNPFKPIEKTEASPVVDENVSSSEVEKNENKFTATKVDKDENDIEFLDL